MKNFIKILCLSGLLSMLLFSCLDDDNGITTTNSVAAGLVYNASPDSDNLNFFADNNQVNTRSLNFGEGQGYFRFFSGNRSLSIQNSAGSELTSLDFTMRAGRYYSIFAVDSLSNISIWALTDSLRVPDEGEFRIRFLHLSPDAPEVSFHVGNDSLGLFSFKQNSEFQAFQAGTYNLSINDADGNQILNVDNVDLRPGNIYTYFASGFASIPTSDSNSLRLNRIINLNP